MPQLLNKTEAFEVREIPQFIPTGQGRFTWLQIQKTNLHTDSVAQELSKLLRVRPRDVAYAGKKDKLAVSTQWFSVPGTVGIDLSAVQQIGNGTWHVIDQQLHDHAIRLGQLKGNAFTLHLDVDITSELPQLQQRTIINYFGQQRFGRQNTEVVREWVAGRFQSCLDLLLSDEGASGILKGLRKSAARQTDPQRILQGAGKRFLQFYASVAQSLVFNAVAEARVDEGLEKCVRIGDLILRSGKSAFHVREDELEVLQGELESGLVACTAPLPGFKVRTPNNDIMKEEQRWSEQSGIPWSVFDRGQIFASPGERRRLLLSFIEEPKWDADKLQLQFALPAGSYASVIMDCLQIKDPRR